MSNRTEDDTLRPEYDFSTGVRGKHYRAYRGEVAVSVRSDGEPSLGALATGGAAIAQARKTQTLDLWCQSASRRLEAARSLTDPQLAKVQEELCQGCPVDPWPYGNATSINPMLVTLGPSPGNSRATGDSASQECLERPPAGKPHQHVYYEDTNHYWDKIRHLASVMLTPPGGTEDDAYALFGNMNLDRGRSGSASQVNIKTDFADWVLRTIKSRLRPRWLVCLGLKTKLKEDRGLRRLFESVFDLDLKRPDVEYRLHESPKHSFREWEVRTGDEPLTVVLWPQHPSRPPLANFNQWRTACEQFKSRHVGDDEAV